MAGPLLNYVHEPLDPGSRDIRGIRFLPEENDWVSLGLVQVIPSCPYYCLSYCWGDYNPTQDKNILVNGKQFLVRANLWDFLDVARRKYPDRLFWIDAICINQSDNDEKGREVKRMGEIFSNATGVVVWLGNGTSPERQLIAHIRQKYDEQPGQPSEREQKRTTVSLLQDGSATTINGVIREVCDNSYWTRAWVVQEICLAASIFLLQGCEDVSWAGFIQMLNQHWSLRRSYAAGIIKAAQDINGKIFSMPFEELTGSYDLIQNCWDKRDKLYSVLSLVKGGERVEPDYTLPLHEIFFRALPHISPEDMFFACSRRLLKALLPQRSEGRGNSAIKSSEKYEKAWSKLDIEDQPFCNFRGRQCVGICRKKRWKDLFEKHENWCRWFDRWYDICSNCAATRHLLGQYFSLKDTQSSMRKGEDVKVMTIGRRAPGHFLFVYSEQDHVWRCRSIMSGSAIFSNSDLLCGISLEVDTGPITEWGRPTLTGVISFSRFGLLNFLIMTWDENSEFFSSLEYLKMC